MCGIAGEVRLREPASPMVVDGQLQHLLHRGPDSSGVYSRHRAAIGQTRLAILDLVTGDPPISTPDGAIGVVLNGEIYNYARLREELVAAGHRFSTQGDTEVLAHLAEGDSAPALATRLEGMFAAAIWDDRTQELFLLRDRFGKKPLYWWRGNDVFVFASEIKALLAHPAVPADLDEAALPAVLHFGYVPSPRTCFRGIRSVPPGSILTVGPDLELTIRRYWEPSLSRSNGAAEHPLDLGAAAELLGDRLRAAVSDRMVADVPVGAFLSGGLDSSVVAALMTEVSAEPVRTFTIGFDGDDGFDEREWAAIVARHLGTEHTSFVAKPDAVDLVERLVWHHDQPFGDSSAVPTWLLAELTRTEVTVALAGDGGDELFAGYERFTAGTAVGALSRVPGALAATGRGSRLVSSWERVPAKVRRFARVAGLGLPDAYREWVAYTQWSVVESLFGGADRWSLDDYDAIWAGSAGAPLLDRLLDLNLRTYLLDDLLPKVDRMSMAHGLEVRSPFLDHRVQELAARFPPALKARGLDRKRVLRTMAADLLPAPILQRPKKGFGVPLDRWFRTDLATYVAATLGSPTARVREHLRGEVLDILLAEHAAGRARHGDTLWTLLTMEVFLRQRGW